MNRKLTLRSVTAAAVLALAALELQAEDKVRVGGERPADIHAFMRLKLGHSQQVLEGIVLEDFEMIAKHASAMSVLLEDEKWMVFQTPDYRTHSNIFNEICRDLNKAAERRNIDAATLAYMEMTMSCVKCHKYTRGVRMASAR
ncbi:MAG: hypothetical protein C0483_05255 [Pirellula sp.]|nr:hypothetical protein [Pirellula sp.]